MGGPCLKLIFWLLQPWYWLISLASRTPNTSLGSLAARLHGLARRDIRLNAVKRYRDNHVNEPKKHAFAWFETQDEIGCQNK